MTDPTMLDPVFYRYAYADLAGLSDEALHRHFEAYGEREGRFASREALDRHMEASGAPIPGNFDPVEYVYLNPDVGDNISNNWEAFNHYSRHGAKEGRRYTTFDLRFYCDLYHDAHPISAAQAAFEIRSSTPEERRFQSLDQLLRAYDQKDAAWLDLFSAREFFLLNFSWVKHERNRAQSIALFLELGVARLAPISFSCQFDAAFFREMHPSLTTLSDYRLYEHWLRHSATEQNTYSQHAWLSNCKLDLDAFPEGFAWQAFAMVHLPQLDVSALGARWQALAHLLALKQAAPAIENADGERAGDFLIAIGKYLREAGAAPAALLVFEAAKRLHDAQVDRQLGDTYLVNGQHRAASECYRQAIAAGDSDIGLVTNLAFCYNTLGDTRAACRALLEEGEAYRGQQAWDRAFRANIDQHFAMESQRARGHFAADRRSEGDAIVTAVTQEITQWLRCGLFLPTREPIVPINRIVLLGVTILRQCKHYRIDQKKEQLEALGYNVEIFSLDQVSDFIQALPGSRAAIFYRVIANPGVIEAIISAEAQGIDTYYDIDDLIFDPLVYPDSYDTFQNAINPAEYIGLMFGTMLHRQAMAMCRFGLASTPALVDHVRKVVRERSCHLVRNALDRRILKHREPISIYPVQTAGAVTIFYGSGTLSHSLDFNNIAVLVLLPLMRQYQNVHLLVIGYLEIDDRLVEVADRIHRFDPIYDLETYYAVLAGCDINLATLSDSVPNNAKSEIKWLEAAVHAVPSVVSATRSMSEVIDDGVTGFLAANNDEWRHALDLIISNPEARREVGRRAQAVALREYDPDRAAKTLAAALGLAATLPGERSLARTKKRALIVNVFFPPQSIGGATRVVADLISSWRTTAAEDWDFAIATTDLECPTAYKTSLSEWMGVPVFRIAPPFVERLDWDATDAKMENWFSEVLRLYRPDVVHFHCVQRLTGSVVQSCVNANIPYIVSAHDGWWLSDYQFLYDERSRERTPNDEMLLGVKPGITIGESLTRKAILRPLLQAAHVIVTPSTTFEQLYRGAGFERVVTIPNGLPKINHLPRRPSSNGRVRLGHIGDTSAHKGFDLVEAALRQGSYENIELLAVSHAWPSGKVVRRRWGATDVTLRGKFPQAEVAVLYAGLDVILAPSACVESFGLVTREANAAGLWVIASNRGAIGEDVRPGIDGFVIDVSGPSELADILDRINANPDIYRNEAPSRYMFTVRQQADAILTLLGESVISPETRGIEGKSDTAARQNSPVN